MSTPTPGDPLAPRRRRGGPVRLTPETVRNLDFPKTPLGRRGYCAAEVERFRARVADEIARSDADKSELREEIARLRAHFRQQAIGAGSGTNGNGLNGAGLNGNGPNGRNGHRKTDTPPNGNALPVGSGGIMIPAALNGGSPNGAGPNGSNGVNGNGSTGNGSTGAVQPAWTVGSEISVQAVNVLSQAQQAADAHIAQAQDYARQLLIEARARYEQILAQAHQEAADAAEQAALTYQNRTVSQGGSSEQEHQDLEAKIAYLRTFAHVTQVQLRSTLHALSHEVDRLTEVVAQAPHPSTGEELVVRS